jgi:hypothetical protein
MPDDPRHPQPLDYHVPPPGQRRPRTFLLIILLAGGIVVALLLVSGGWFFSVSFPTASPVVPAPSAVGKPPVPGFAVSLQDPSDPELGAAQAATTNALDALLAGTLAADDPLAPVARKVAGYQTWSVTARTPVAGPPPAWDFSGTLAAAPGRSARFTVRMVKQQSGHWAVGLFRGPDPQ